MWDAWDAIKSRFPFTFSRVRGPGFDLRFHTALDPYWESFCSRLGHAATAEDAQRFLRSWGSDVVYLWLVGFLDRSEDSGRITDDTGWLQWPLKGSRLHAPSNAPPFAPMHAQEGQAGRQQAVWAPGGPGQAGGNGGGEPPASPSDSEVRRAAWFMSALQCGVPCGTAAGCGSSSVLPHRVGQ